MIWSQKPPSDGERKACVCFRNHTPKAVEVHPSLELTPNHLPPGTSWHPTLIKPTALPGCSFFSQKQDLKDPRPPLTPGGSIREMQRLILVLVEAPEGVQTTEWVMCSIPLSPVETLTLRWLQEALLGHPLLPPASSLHGEGLWCQ